MYKSPAYRTRRSLAVTTSSSIDEFTPVKSVKKQNLPTPKTPANFETPIARCIDPVMARIQRDFNSPSAAARVRANKAMKSPSFKKKAYEQFDVQYEKQDIITEEERNASIKPKSIIEIFQNCKLYVEVRTGDDNRSAGIKNRLLRDGIAVNEKLYKDTTHVIFKDGLLGTFKTAAKLGIPVTTILWLDACKAQKRLVECEKFPISNLDRYERPELYKRLRREKSMQPDLTRSGGKQFKNLVDRSFSQDDKRDDPRKHETILENEGMELTLQENQTTTIEVMDVTAIDHDLEKWKENIRRFTTFTPNPMEQTGRRQTLFTPQNISSIGTDFSTPDKNSEKTVIFNSSNRIGKFSRNSVLEISMNMFEMNCKAMSQKNKVDSPESVKKVEPVKIQELRKDTSVVRKRKLFNPDYEDFENEQKENLDKTFQGSQKKAKLNKTIGQVEGGFRTPVNKKTAVSKTKAETVRRRETIACFKTRETAVKVKTPAKIRASPTKYIVCTNMSSNDKKVIHAAILKLGGKFESEVSSKTTHVITPNQERTMNVLRGVIRACNILNVDWIHDSIAKERWAETTLYTHSICDSNRVHERSVLGSQIYKNTTFSQRGAVTNFYIVHDSIQTSRKIDYLKEIIVLCNGKVTEKLSEADIIISEETFNTLKTVVIPSFVFDSAMKGTIMEAANYRPK